MGKEQMLVTVQVGGNSYMVTPARQAIVSQLMKREWFRRTAPELQIELLALPQQGKENHDGFLKDLAARPESIGGVDVLRLVRLARGNVGVIPVFMVYNSQKKSEYTYEYFSWRYGTASGAKGIVFVTDASGNITHFIVLKGEKFATGRLTWDAIGGFADLDVGNDINMLEVIKKEIREELGLPDLEFEHVYNFGEVVTDAGMTNSRPDIFAAVIKESDAQNISVTPLNPDEYELRSGPLIFPIRHLRHIILKNTDSYFRNAVLLSVVHGIINYELLAT